MPALASGIELGMPRGAKGRRAVSVYAVADQPEATCLRRSRTGGSGDVMPGLRSPGGGLHCWCSHGDRRGRNRECLVDLVEGAAFGFVAEHPEANQPEDVPRGEIYEGGAEHGEIGRRRLDDVARTHD